ncbi:MAG: hypothetical protein B7W98_00355 [Parcubacteria group bacterium 20-58-5]|nr:MAG: hypothetical protein B7W98_00355 [Parcubacteria group bacterium 20-58-5]OYV63801.1 MAG: hypothetical protein B7X03_00545 [Parcubacteria group bacterium 21-58-10]
MLSHTRFIIAGITTSLILIIATPLTAYAVGLIPFGGVAVTTPVPCIGSGLDWVEIVQPPPRPPLAIIFYPSPFLYYEVWHPGQFVLGLLAPVGFCLTSPHQGFWAPTAFFYGSSL